MSEELRARAAKLKPGYPDYIDDPDGLDRFREQVRRQNGHDMAICNNNSLGRLIDTIERLRFERDTLSFASSAAGQREVERLREALEGIERVMRENIHENDGPDRIWLDGVAHEGPLVSWAIRCFRKVGELARAALTPVPGDQ